MERVSATLCDLRPAEMLHNAHRRPYVRYLVWAARVGARSAQNLCTGFLWAPRAMCSSRNSSQMCIVLTEGARGATTRSARYPPVSLLTST
jgi:hypothetical protein